MIYNQQWTVLGIVIPVQIAATTLLAIVTHSSPFQIVDQVQTLILIRLSAEKVGISLASILPYELWKQMRV